MDCQKKIENLRSLIQEKEEELASLRDALARSQELIVNIHQSIPLKLFRNYDASIGKIVPIRLKKRIKMSGGKISSENSNQLKEHLSKSKPTKLDIVCFPMINWEYRYQRPQHLLSKFAKNNHRVFYLTTTIQPIKDGYEIAKLDENIYGVSLSCSKYFDIYKDKFEKSNLKSVLDSFVKLKNDLGIAGMSFVMFPTWQPVVSELRKLFDFKIVYDCADNITAFPNINKERKKEEEMLVENSDLIVANSRPIYDKFRKKNSQTILVHNGCDFEHFNRRHQENLLKDLKKPVIGYFGAIAEWFDAELVEFVARKKSDKTFVFIGDTYGSNLKRLRTMDNVLFLGERPYTELPMYLNGFDVCIIPFKLTPLVIDTHPIKIYEYFAAGKPVVATNMLELYSMRQLCYIAKGKEDFVSKLDEALRENDQNMTRKRIEYSSKNTWNDRFDSIYSELQKIQSLTRK